MIENEDTYIISITTFRMGTDKEAALKPLEESAEVYGAYQNLTRKYDLVSFADEIADTIQACCNLAKRYGIDLQAAMKRCQERNRERGRYEKVRARDKKRAIGASNQDNPCVSILQGKEPRNNAFGGMHNVARTC